MEQKKIPVCEPTLKGNELKYATDCINSNWISSMGKYIEMFEEKFSNFCGCKYGVGCCNGTVAIHLALESLGIGKGDEVIIPSFTMIATANAVIYTGAKPVFIDAEPKTWNMDISRIESKINKKTKAIIPVHTYGHPVDMDSLNAIAKKHKLFVIEDSAEAHGAEYKGKRCGSLSDVSCFSFYANKIITTGEGGMVVTNNSEIAEKSKLLRNHAFTKNRFMHELVGYNYRMTNIQAAIGLAQMENADKLVSSRINNAMLYNSMLKNVKGIRLPPQEPWAKNVYWMYGILIEKEFGKTKEQVMELLDKMGIQTRSFFYPMHKQPVYLNNPDLAIFDRSMPVSEELFRKGLYLPSASHLSKDEIKRVVESIKKIGNS